MQVRDQVKIFVKIEKKLRYHQHQQQTQQEPNAMDVTIEECFIKAVNWN